MNAPTTRTTLKRLPERGAHDRSTIDPILDEAFLCHYAIVVDDTPIVIPTLFARVDDVIYLHGSPASRSLRSARATQICVNVTLADGIVVARSGFHSSMNYRSVTIFGEATVVDDPDEKRAALLAMVDHTIPGRNDTARPMTDKEVTGTLVLRVALDEASAKVRSGGPVDDEEDYDLPYWGGVIPITTVFGMPETDDLSRLDVPVPDHLANYRRPGKDDS